MEIQLKLSTLKAIVEAAEIAQETLPENKRTTPVVQIYKTAYRQDGELEDQIETKTFRVETVPFEVMEDAG
ncbi:MAG: hypothetical protein ACI9JN_001269 [Bacteroidia bacterium]|jgi:hypothetical protein